MNIVTYLDTALNIALVILFVGGMLLAGINKIGDTGGMGEKALVTVVVAFVFVAIGKAYLAANGGAFTALKL